MGRKAKNKQPPPAPLKEVTLDGDSTSKKLGKRKALDAKEQNGRPTKKSKNSDGKPKTSSHSQLPKEKAITTKRLKKGKPPPEDNADSESEGWEDVDSDEDIQTHKQ